MTEKVKGAMRSLVELWTEQGGTIAELVGAFKDNPSEAERLLKNYGSELTPELAIQALETVTSLAAQRDGRSSLEIARSLGMTDAEYKKIYLEVARETRAELAAQVPTRTTPAVQRAAIIGTKPVARRGRALSDAGALSRRDGLDRARKAAEERSYLGLAELALQARASGDKMLEQCVFDAAHERDVGSAGEAWEESVRDLIACSEEELRAAGVQSFVMGERSGE